MGGIVPKSTHDKVTDPLKLVPDDKSDPLGITSKPADIQAPIPPAPPPGAPQTTDARVRARQAADAQSRKRGRRSTILTGDEGVGDTPLGRKTLVGS